MSQQGRFGVMFVLIDNGATDIYQMPDGNKKQIERVTFSPTVGENVLLTSRDGKKIVFGTGPTLLPTEPSDLVAEKLYRIYFLDTVGKDLQDITDFFTLPPITTPMRVADWSPDQKQFAFINYGTGLGIMNIDGTDRKDISIPSLGDIPAIKRAKWSPDGKKIALIHGYAPETPEHTGWALLIYEFESKRTLQIADYETNCGDVEWSVSSQQLIATCSYIQPYTEIPGRETVQIFDIEHSGQSYEHISFNTCYDPSWSPDGKRIVFVCEKEANQSGIFIVNSKGSDIYEVNLGELANSTILKDPTWSPDGTQIVYIAGSDAKSTKIYSVNIDGSNNHPLTDQEAYYILVSVYPAP